MLPLLTLRDLARRPFERFLYTIMRRVFRASQGIECHTLVEVDRSKSVQPDDLNAPLRDRSNLAEVLRYAHETDDCALQQQYDQPMAAVDQQKLKGALAEAVVHRLRRREKT